MEIQGKFFFTMRTKWDRIECVCGVHALDLHTVEYILERDGSQSCYGWQWGQIWMFSKCRESPLWTPHWPRYICIFPIPNTWGHYLIISTCRGHVETVSYPIPGAISLSYQHQGPCRNSLISNTCGHYLIISTRRGHVETFSYPTLRGHYSLISTRRAM